jgi:hypothetical protein
VIDGYPTALGCGPNHVALLPGVHHIAIHMPWLWKFGHAEITVDTSVAPIPTVYYAMPWVTIFLRGAIGLAPVKNPGLAAFIAVLATPLLLVVACAWGVSLFAE